MGIFLNRGNKENMKFKIRNAIRAGRTHLLSIGTIGTGEQTRLTIQGERFGDIPAPYKAPKGVFFAYRKLLSHLDVCSSFHPIRHR